MDWLDFLSTTLSFLSLLIISSSIAVGAARFRIPYTVSLVAIGILLGWIAPRLPFLGFLDDFTLTPEILLYIFLPVLLFESAYNMRFRDLMNNIGSISLLAIVSLFFSALAIGGGIYFVFDFFGMPIPFLVALLFGSLISATDPVSVLALFKELGAPKRLTLIFEGESLFNDGTALALFLVVLSFFVTDVSHANLYAQWMHALSLSLHMDLRIVSGILSFLLMVFGGIFFGAVVGFVFSRTISSFGKNKILELTLTIVLAHITFLGADLINHFILPLSGVIATTIAALVVGNYGRYKLSHETRTTMGEYWEFFAHISNSIVFLLVGVMIVALPIAWESMILPIILAIIIVMIARALSVYAVVIPWNFTGLESRIPSSWMHLLSWGSLRWALAIVMALLIPADIQMTWGVGEISVQSFVLALTVGSIIFTTFIKATTIVPLIKGLRIDRLTPVDALSFIESRLLFLFWVRKRLQNLAQKGYFDISEREKLEGVYEKEINTTTLKLRDLIDGKNRDKDDTLLRVLSLYALQRERTFLLELFAHSEIDEVLFRYQLEKIEGQIDRIDAGKTQLKDEIEKALDKTFSVRLFLTWLQIFELSHYKKYERDFLKHRTRAIILEKVLEQLSVFQELPLIAEHPSFHQVRELYERLLQTALSKLSLIRSEHPSIHALEARLVHQTVLKQQSEEIDELIEHEVISRKVGKRLLESIE